MVYRFGHVPNLIWEEQMDIRGFFTIIFVLLLACQGISFAADVGEECPKFTLKIIDGEKVQSDAIKGKNPLLLVFWATWCSPCKEKIFELKKIYSEFQPKGLKIIAINPCINDSLKKVKRFIKKHKISYPVFLDEGSIITKRFKINGLPTIVIVNKDGIIRYRAHELPKDFRKDFKSLTK